MRKPTISKDEVLRFTIRAEFRVSRRDMIQLIALYADAEDQLPTHRIGALNVCRKMLEQYGTDTAMREVEEESWHQAANLIERLFPEWPAEKEGG